MVSTIAKPAAILFDLDGTLVDSAPDLAAAMNQVRQLRALPPVPYELLRPHASAGARGLIAVAFGLTPGDDQYEVLRVAFLDTYAADIARHSRLFAGVPELLEALAADGIAWGIVTNKAARFTDALVPLLPLSAAACVISGDSTAHAKPHPAPLLEAARRIGTNPESCWYVGDDLRDIEAGRAARMRTVSVGWGYGDPLQPVPWEADSHVSTPSDLRSLLIAICSDRAAVRTVAPIGRVPGG